MSFDTFCERVARDFIQTVMVVDDQAVLTEQAQSSVPKQVVNPLGRGFVGPAPEPDGEARGSPPAALLTYKSHGLDGRQLTRSFARLGVACSIYVPSEAGTEDVQDTVHVAGHADVVVLDWRIGSTTNKAREILREIVRADDRENGRLRLIAVYTGQPGPEGIRDEIAADLEAHGMAARHDTETVSPALRRGALRIVVLNKAHAASPGAQVVSEDELPARLVKEFTALSRGVMPAVALGCITAIRNSAHHVVAKFHAGLDPALAAHRALQPLPDDAEGYATALVADELRSIVEVNSVGTAHAGMEVLRCWIDYLAARGHGFSARGDGTSKLTSDAALDLLQNGCDQIKPVMAALKPPVKGNQPQDDALATIFSLDPGAAAEANLEFSRLAALRREAFGRSVLPQGWAPTLTLGTVLMRLSDRAFFACIQPVCDSVRIEEGERRFPMVPLRRAASTAEKFSLVIRLADGTDALLSPILKPHALQHVSFMTDPARLSVHATKVGNSYRFACVAGGEYEWLADLKESQAMRLVQSTAGQVDRIGLDEYEWLRKRAK